MSPITWRGKKIKMGRKELFHGDGYIDSYLLLRAPLGAAAAEMSNMQPCPPGLTLAQSRTSRAIRIAGMDQNANEKRVVSVGGEAKP